MKAMIIDINICNGCYNCQIACKDEHVSNDWTPYAKPQPDTGQFWMKNTDIVQGTVPKVRVRYMHDICQHCDDAPCIEACKAKAIYKREKDGIVIIDPTKCTGARQCLDACPYKVIYFNTDLNIAQKCTFCAHLLDDGWIDSVFSLPGQNLSADLQKDPFVMGSLHGRAQCRCKMQISNCQFNSILFFADLHFLFLPNGSRWYIEAFQ
jgi:Fe-S-cluster-containing dehydrogenase component